MTDVGRTALAARVFTIAALTTLAALSGASYLPGALLVLVTAGLAQTVSLLRPWRQWRIALVEGCVVAIAAVASVPHQTTMTPYLVIPALIGGLDLGRRGVVRVVVAEFGVLAIAWQVGVGRWDRVVADTGFTWLATAIGVGLMGTLLRRAVSTGDADSSYRSALGLIRRLDALSGRLSGGLDAVGIAEELMEESGSLVPTSAAGVFVRSRGGEVSPLRYSVGTRQASITWGAELAARCWQQRSPVQDGHRLALPLVAGDELVAVLAAETTRPVEARDLATLTERLRERAVPLQAALLFGRVRDTATSQERQRIAREVHDGVAQDVASLGYLVDNLATASTDPVQREQLGVLRAEVTRVVTELRHSIFDLRQEVAAGTSLGESLAAYANGVGFSSNMTVHVTLDEEGPRLPSDIEFELFRIGQEAMANARKHSAAGNLWLRCTVRAPYAEIEVRDDGSCPHRPAPDSQGLKIMHERALSIGADLRVQAPTTEEPGTRVRVRVDEPAR